MGLRLLAYAFALITMLCLVLSGMLDGMRPRVVTGWIGLACAIAAITWAVVGSLLKRAAFLQSPTSSRSNSRTCSAVSS